MCETLWCMLEARGSLVGLDLLCKAEQVEGQAEGLAGVRSWRGCVGPFMPRAGAWIFSQEKQGVSEQV